METVNVVLSLHSQQKSDIMNVWIKDPASRHEAQVITTMLSSLIEELQT
jgi:hypothetical protein